MGPAQAARASVQANTQVPGARAPRGHQCPRGAAQGQGGGRGKGSPQRHRRPCSDTLHTPRHGALAPSPVRTDLSDSLGTRRHPVMQGAPTAG